MNLNTKTVTHNVHSASFSPDDLKAVALSAVRNKLGLADETRIASSKTEIGEDGAVNVEIVEILPAPGQASPAPAVPGFPKSA